MLYSHEKRLLWIHTIVVYVLPTDPVVAVPILEHLYLHHLYSTLQLHLSLGIVERLAT